MVWGKGNPSSGDPWTTYRTVDHSNRGDSRRGNHCQPRDPVLPVAKGLLQMKDDGTGSLETIQIPKTRGDESPDSRDTKGSQSSFHGLVRNPFPVLSKNRNPFPVLSKEVIPTEEGVIDRTETVYRKRTVTQ